MSSTNRDIANSNAPAASKRQRSVFPFAAPSARRRWRRDPLVSVVLPVYNGSCYLRASAESVLSQSNCRIELVIVDDGSTDAPERALGPLLNDPRVRFIRQDNQGLPGALNTGFANARGQLLSWTSADNLYLPGALSRMADYLVENPAIGLVYANVQLINADGAPSMDSSYRVADQDPGDRSVLLLPTSAESLSEMNDNFINSAFMFRRWAALAVGEHRPETVGYEDYDFWLRLQSFAPFAHLDSTEAVYQYRLHPESMTSRLDSADLSGRQLQSLTQTARSRQLAVAISRIELHAEQDSPGKDAAIRLCSLLADGSSPIKLDYITGGDRSSNAIDISVFRGGSCLPVNQVRLHATELASRERMSQVAVTPLVPLFMRGTTAPVYLLSTSWQTGGAAGRQIAIPPQLNVPRLFRRARGSSFGAVTAQPGARGTGILFPSGTPDADSAAAAALIHSLPDLCIAIVCLTAGQREFADKVNLALASNRNLRIIDLSNSSARPYAPDGIFQSLLYLLSSAHFLLRIEERPGGLQEFLEREACAGLAAAAGLPMLQINSGTEQIDPAAELLSAFLTQAPHVGIAALAEYPADALQEYLLQTVQDGVNADSAEQWLAERSDTSTVRNLRNLLAQLAVE